MFDASHASVGIRGVARGVIMNLQVALERPTDSQPIKINLHREDLLEAFQDGGVPIKYSERKPCL
jgi:hypothetical protein